MDIYINNTLLTSTKLPVSIQRVDFYDIQRVADEIRGYLIFNNGSWHFIGQSQFYNMYAGTIELQKIALILESPHKDEYDKHFHPIRPANGKSGAKIASDLVNRVALIGNLKNNIAYEVFLMNPVQFQASCHHWVGNSNCRNHTNKVFRALFNKNKGNQRAYFINRLNAYNPDILFCCCTSNLKNVVYNAIVNSSVSSKPYCTDHHPSVW